MSLASILQTVVLLLLDGAHQRLRRTSGVWYLLHSIPELSTAMAPHTQAEYCKNRRQTSPLPTMKNLGGIGCRSTCVVTGRAIRYHLRPHPTPAAVRRPLR